MSLINLLYVGIVLGCLAFSIYWFINILIYRNKVNKFPGKKTNFFIGDIQNLSRKRDKLFKEIRALNKEFPGGFRAWGGFFASYNFNRAEEYELILSNPKYILKGGIYNFVISWLGEGLLTSTGTKWHQRRKILTPAFHFNILRRFVTIFGEHCEKFVEELKDECSKEETNISPIITALTLGLICETTMGVRLNKNDRKQAEYKQALEGIAELVVERLLNLHYYYDIIFKLFPKGRKFFKYINISHQFTQDIIKERERTFQDSDVENLDTNDDDYATFSKKRFAMLDLLISAKRNTGEIDDIGIRDEVETFMFEGHDTTTSAISFILFCLANYKDVQEKSRQEIDDIFQGSTRHANYQDLQSMVYLERVIKEVLRLYPSVPFIGRTLEEDVLLHNGGKYIMPATSSLYFHIYDLHRDERFFKDPLKFDPDRFLPDNVSDRHPYAFIPFSAGPRNCIGQKFAMLEIKSVISSILRHFEIDPIDTPESITFIAHLVLRTKDGIRVKFRHRLP